MAQVSWSRLQQAVTELVKDVGADFRAIGGVVVNPQADLGTLADAFDNLVKTAGGELIGVAGVLGFRYKVSEYEFKVTEQLTRGSRIDDPDGYKKLVAQGFRSIVDFTAEGTKDSLYARAAGLNALNIRILDNDAPTVEQMITWLNFATRPENQPCYGHCEAGKGRTGVAVACYRMAVLGATVEEALADAQNFGCSQPDQLQFIADFGRMLQAGQIPGYRVAQTIYG